MEVASPQIYWTCKEKNIRGRKMAHMKLSSFSAAKITPAKRITKDKTTCRCIFLVSRRGNSYKKGKFIQINTRVLWRGRQGDQRTD